MWTSVPAHIYPHLSKIRLLLETNGGINEQYLQWVPYMPGTTVHDVQLLLFEIGRKAKMRVLLFAPFMNVLGYREPTLPSKHLETLRLNRKFCLHNIPNTTINTNTY